jgi:hypothetical protein
MPEAYGVVHEIKQSDSIQSMPQDAFTKHKAEVARSFKDVTSCKPSYPLFDSAEALKKYAEVNNISEEDAAVIYKLYQKICLPFAHHTNERSQDFHDRKSNDQNTAPGVRFATADELSEYAAKHKINEYVAATLFRDASTSIKETAPVMVAAAVIAPVAAKSRVEAAFDFHKIALAARGANAPQPKPELVFATATELAMYACNNSMSSEQAATAFLWC